MGYTLRPASWIPFETRPVSASLRGSSADSKTCRAFEELPCLVTNESRVGCAAPEGLAADEHRQAGQRERRQPGRLAAAGDLHRDRPAVQGSVRPRADEGASELDDARRADGR